MRRAERTDTDTMRQVSLAGFLMRLGHEPVRGSGNELWYRMPYRNKRMPSFRASVAERLWHDFGPGRGGDIFTLTREFARNGDFMAQVRFITETARIPLTATEKPLCLSEPSEPTFKGVEAALLLRSPLTDYLVEWGIPYAITFRYCYRLNCGARGERYFTIGFPNATGGYEICNRYSKGCVPPKDMLLVKTESFPTDVCSLSKGFTDLLSAAMLGLETGDSLVLNSVANVGKAIKHLDGYVHTDCFFDRDDAGRRMLEVPEGCYDGRVYGHSALYDDCKDLSEYL